jgi:translation initiation factor eIF-2B subunit epsilon
VGNNTLIGSHTRVCDNAQISASVIGQRCIIGADAIIRNAYIFDDTVIGPKCVVEHSIVGAGVNIKEKSRVEKGCLIGDGVIIGPQAVLLPFERLSKRTKTDDTDEDEGSDEDEDEDEDEDDEEDEEGDDEDEDSEVEDVEASEAPFSLDTDN